ncbi:MAG: MHYT domain-containing protein [Cyanobacteria bacterium J06607_10]
MNDALLLTSYNYWLVLLSIVIAILTGYTALDVAARVTAAKGWTQAIWLCCGAVAMGMGIWSMHFIGMLAFRLPLEVAYEFWIVAASVLPAMLASGLALFLVSRETLGWFRLIAGSVLMGAGIVAMHYGGMMAMKMPAAMTYDIRWVAVSVVSAIAASFAGLFIVYCLRTDSAHRVLTKLAASLAIGLAIPITHYTGMAAARFIPDDASGDFSVNALRSPVNQMPIVIAVLVGTVVIFGIAWTSTFLDRLKNSEAKFKALAQKQVSLNNQLRESEARQRQKNEELQAALDTLKSVQAQLIHTEKMSGLGQLVAGVAHEVNNPVNFIHGNLKYIRRYTQDMLHLVELYQKHYPKAAAEIEICIEDIELDFLQDDLNKVLSSMELGTERIREIVLSLRNFSRTDEGALKQVNLHEGIDSTLMILQHRINPTAGFPAVKIVQDYDALPLVECFPGQINQVFMNILANALDALGEVISTAQHNAEDKDKAAAQITIRTATVGDDWVEVAIADNGPGIPSEVKNRIFDPFFTTKPVGKGTGMGLSISYKIITERHGGKLECHSSAEQGTEFIIQLPICQPN